MYFADEGKRTSTYNNFLKIVILVLPLILFLIHYLAYYPGAFSTDSIGQYSQALSNRYSDWHPVVQTLFAFKIPLLLTNGWVGSIVFFQCVCFAGVISYLFFVLLKYTNRTYTIISMFFILLNPQTFNIGMYPWKDVSFAIGALLLTVYALQVCFSKGEWLKCRRNRILFIITAALVTLFRHNGILFTVPMIIGCSFFVSKKRAAVLGLSVLMIVMGIKGPLYSAMDVKKPGQRQIETLGVPINVIGAVVTYDPDSLDNDVKEFAYKIAPKEVWEKKYVYGTYNNMKWDPQTNNDVMEEYGAVKVVSMMFECIKSSPKTALRGLVELTKPTYYIVGNRSTLFEPLIVDNDYGIVRSGVEGLRMFCQTFAEQIGKAGAFVFLNLGLMHWVLIGSILLKMKWNKFSYWKRIFFILPVFCYNYGTTLLLTGAEDADRFFYYTFLLMPALLVFIYAKVEEEETEHSVCIEV